MSNKKEGFEITQERIDVINTATEYLHKLNDLESGALTIFMGPTWDNAIIF
jgi:hypothetical protein